MYNGSRRAFQPSFVLAPSQRRYRSSMYLAELFLCTRSEKSWRTVGRSAGGGGGDVHSTPIVSWVEPMDCKIKLTWLFRGLGTEYQLNLIPVGTLRSMLPLPFSPSSFFFFFFFVFFSIYLFFSLTSSFYLHFALLCFLLCFALIGFIVEDASFWR